MLDNFINVPMYNGLLGQFYLVDVSENDIVCTRIQINAAQIQGDFFASQAMETACPTLLLFAKEDSFDVHVATGQLGAAYFD